MNLTSQCSILYMSLLKQRPCFLVKFCILLDKLINLLKYGFKCAVVGCKTWYSSDLGKHLSFSTKSVIYLTLKYALGWIICLIKFQQYTSRLAFISKEPIGSSSVDPNHLKNGSFNKINYLSFATKIRWLTWIALFPIWVEI